MPGIVVVGLHDVHHRAAQPDDARRTAEQHTGIGAEDLGEEPRPALLLGDSRELPGVIEDQAQRGEDGGQEVARGQQAAPGVAVVAPQAVTHPPHKKQVGGVDDPEADLGRDHGQRKMQHLPPQPPVDAPELQVVPQFSGDAQEQNADKVAADDGQQVAVGTPLEAHQIQHVEGHGGHGAQHAVHGHQLVPLAAAHELGAQGAQAAHEHIEVNEQAVLGHVGQEPCNGPAQDQDAKAAQNGEQAVGEHLLFAVALIQTKADDRIGHAHGHKGDEQVRVLAQDLGQAQIRDLGHGVGQERLHDQREQFGRKAGNGKDEGVAGQFGVFIAAGLFFVFQGKSASCFYFFNSSRRAFQSGSSFATSAQNAGLWLACKKWQYSCTTT